MKQLQDHLTRFWEFRNKIQNPEHGETGDVGKPRAFPYVLQTYLPRTGDGGLEILSYNAETDPPSFTLNADSGLWSFRRGELVVITGPPPLSRPKLQGMIDDMDHDEGIIWLDVDPKDLIEASILAKNDLENRAWRADVLYKQDAMTSIIGFPMIASDPHPPEAIDLIRNKVERHYRPFLPEESILREGEGEENCRNVIAFCCPTDEPARHIVLDDQGKYAQPTTWGWMIPTLSDYSISTGYRWQHWMDLVNGKEGALGNIPQIDFVDPHPRAKEMLLHCLEYILPDWEGCSPKDRLEMLRWFFQWMLWGMGHESVQERPPYSAIFPSGRVHSDLIQAFDFGLLYLWPSDYWGWLIQHVMGEHIDGTRKVKEEVYPIFDEQPDGDNPFEVFFDVSPGFGKRLLWASNRSYNYMSIAYANEPEGSSLYLSALWINAMMHAPWLIHPPAEMQSSLNLIQSSASLTSALSGRTIHDTMATWPVEDHIQTFRPIAFKVIAIDSGVEEDPPAVMPPLDIELREDLFQEQPQEFFLELQDNLFQEQPQEFSLELRGDLFQEQPQEHSFELREDLFELQQEQFEELPAEQEELRIPLNLKRKEATPEPELVELNTIEIEAEDVLYLDDDEP